jgi:hypothetical protein
VSRLRRPLDAGGERPADGERRAGPVDVAPAQRQELSEPEPGVRGDADRLAVAVVLEVLKLAAGQHGGTVEPGLERAGDGLDLLG